MSYATNYTKKEIMINRTQKEIIKKWPLNWTVPIVSIHCITYNQQSYIAKALDSFLLQETDFPFEIVVHDDASTDKTADIIREYEAKYPQIIKPIYEIENQYSKKDGSLNKIMNRACKGKYVAFCEGDDFWCDSRKLQMQFDAMENHPECSLCTHIVQEITENEVPITQRPGEGVFNEITNQSDFGKILFVSKQHPLQTSSFFIRKKDIQNNEHFFSNPGCGDEKILRICLKEGSVFFIPSVMSCYRRFSVSSWSSRNSNVNRQTKIISNTIELNRLFDEYTQYKFHSFIEIGNNICQLNIFIINREFNNLFSSQFKSLSRKYIPFPKLQLYFLLSKMPSFIVNIFFSIQIYLKQLRFLRMLLQWWRQIKTKLLCQ